MTWHEHGLALFRTGDFPAARQAFGEDTRDRPDQPWAWLWLSRAALRAGDVAVAADAARRAVDLAPTFAKARAQLRAAEERLGPAQPPRYWVIQPPPEPVPAAAAPPTEGIPVVTGRLFEATPQPRFDVALIDELNEGYRDRPVAANPARADAASRDDKARRRLANVHSKIDLRGKRVLEFGCAAGLEIWRLANEYGADAHGVDIASYSTWAELSAEHATFTLADLTQHNPYGDNSFDRIISFSVWEHVARPVEALEQVARMLRPDGIAFIFAMLVRSAVGSHFYRDLFFPWPHLLFSDDVIEDWYVSHGHPPKRPSWCNEMTWPHYEDAIARIGFDVKAVKLDRRDLDEPFLERFADVLGKYPREDLATDAFTLVLGKPS